MNDFPLVTIGIPTYNRASRLKRAVESALSQDYPHLEIIISDNASSDDTQTVAENFAQGDLRVRYICQSTNLGAVGNFQAVLKEARGEYFMWLADDDWMDASYISACANILSERPDYALVSGRALYLKDKMVLFEGERINLLRHSANQRVLNYYREVAHNGIFYGLMRRDQVLKVPFSGVLGGDWFVVAALAFQGKVRTLDSVILHRSSAGASANLEALASQMGSSKSGAKNPHFLLCSNILKDLAWQSRVYHRLTRVERLWLGSSAFIVCYNRYAMHDENSIPALWNKFRFRLRFRSRLKWILKILTQR